MTVHVSFSPDDSDEVETTKLILALLTGYFKPRTKNVYLSPLGELSVSVERENESIPS